MNKNIKSDFFLECNAVCNLLLNEALILFLRNLALTEKFSLVLYISRLRERTDSGSREYRKSKPFLLDLLSFFECRKSGVIRILYIPYPFLNLLIEALYPSCEKTGILLI